MGSVVDLVCRSICWMLAWIGCGGVVALIVLRIIDDEKARRKK